MRRGVTSTDSHLMGTLAAEKMSLTVWEIFIAGPLAFAAWCAEMRRVCLPQARSRLLLSW